MEKKLGLLPVMLLFRDSPKFFLSPDCIKGLIKAISM